MEFCSAPLSTEPSGTAGAADVDRDDGDRLIKERIESPLPSWHSQRATEDANIIGIENFSSIDGEASAALTLHCETPPLDRFARYPKWNVFIIGAFQSFYDPQHT